MIPKNLLRKRHLQCKNLWDFTTFTAPELQVFQHAKQTVSRRPKAFVDTCCVFPW